MRTLFLLLLSIIALASANAQQERRLALVLANEEYPPELGRLTNTHEDAAKIEAALQYTGFAVTKVLDANANGLLEAITEFELAIDLEASDGDNVVVFVYASMHGAAAEVDGRTRNFLLPANEPIRSTGELIRKGVRMDQLISGLSSTNAKAVLVVSDACRNELGTSFSKSTTKGFVPVRSRPGVLVAYATAPGSTTPDDGVFADLLSRELREPGRKASFAMLEAIESVARRRSLDGQPFLSSGGLPEWLCFNGCRELRATTPPPQILASDEGTALAQAISANTLTVYVAFRDRFPNSSNLEFVNSKIAELTPRPRPPAPAIEVTPQASFDQAKSLLLQFDYAGSEAGFREFLRRFPEDRQAGEAHYWLAETLYQQESYAESGSFYTDLLRNFPDHPRAPESLAKLARSMRLIGDANRACNALELLPQRYPLASDLAKNLAAAERIRSSCD